ncbi:hypothetical protein BC567DRAFT_12547 [Phyllosticta citribraziliensis]
MSIASCMPCEIRARLTTSACAVLVFESFCPWRWETRDTVPISLPCRAAVRWAVSFSAYRSCTKSSMRDLGYVGVRAGLGQADHSFVSGHRQEGIEWSDSFVGLAHGTRRISHNLASPFVVPLFVPSWLVHPSSTRCAQMAFVHPSKRWQITSSALLSHQYGSWQKLFESCDAVAWPHGLLVSEEVDGGQRTPSIPST